MSKVGGFNPVLFPAPDAVASALYNLGASGALWVHISTSVKRVLVGFGLASALALPLGLLLGLYRPLEAFCDGLLSVLRPIPPFAWIPLAILWFGIGDGSTQFVVLYAAFWPILLNTIAGVRDIDRSLLKAASSIGSRGLSLFVHVIVPGSLPLVLTGLRIGLGIAWMSIVAAELVAAQSGLGFMIMFYRSLFITENVIVGMLAIGVLGYLMDRLMRAIEKRLMPWRPGLKV
ncbi:MAG: ABC transporter permease [Candidatus Rokubacteria bacterium]|nr:ABC transporter permease [Candidatus Rokubacteria bacterium]